jgi:hypothetical protein
VNLGSSRQHLLLGAALVCIAGLYLLATASEPASIPLADLADYEGETVRVTGLAVQVERYDSSASLLLRDSSTSAWVYVPDGVTVRRGDRIRVTGTVQRYEGRLEIMADGVTVLAYTNDSIPLPLLASRHDDFCDTTVTVNGTAANVTRHGFRLADGTCSILVRHPGRTYNITRGDEVTVTAMLRYDPDTMCFYLSTERSSHQVTRLG